MTSPGPGDFLAAKLKSRYPMLRRHTTCQNRRSFERGVSASFLRPLRRTSHIPKSCIRSILPPEAPLPFVCRARRSRRTSSPSILCCSWVSLYEGNSRDGARSNRARRGQPDISVKRCPANRGDPSGGFEISALADGPLYVRPSRAGYSSGGPRPYARWWSCSGQA